MIPYMYMRGACPEETEKLDSTWLRV